jgi:hypothetical protein
MIKHGTLLAPDMTARDRPGDRQLSLGRVHSTLNGPRSWNSCSALPAGVGTARGDSYAKAFYAYAIKKFRDQDKHPRSGWNVSGG